MIVDKTAMLRSKAPGRRVSGPVLAVGVVGVFAALALCWALTHSAWIQWVVLLASVLAWRLLMRFGRFQPFPPWANQSDSGPKPRRWLLVTGVLVTMLALTIGLSFGLARLGMYPGPWAIWWLVLGAPFIVVAHRIGWIERSRSRDLR